MCIFPGEDRLERYHTFVMIVKFSYIQYHDAHSKVSSTNETQVSPLEFEDYTDKRMCLNMHTCTVLTINMPWKTTKHIDGSVLEKSSFWKIYFFRIYHEVQAVVSISLKEMKLGQVWRAARAMHLTNNKRATEHIHISQILIATLFIDFFKTQIKKKKALAKTSLLTYLFCIPISKV